MKSHGGKVPGCPGKKDRSRHYSALVIILLLASLLVLPVAAVSNVTLSDNSTLTQTVTKSISGAIASAKPGSVLVIESGEWEGNFIIDKPVSLIGMDTGKGRPNIVTEEGLAGITIASDGVTLDGFTISGNADSAIWIEGNETVLSNNRIIGTPIAISAISGTDLSISENTILNHSVGIYVEKGVSGIITLNNFDNPVNAKSLSTNVNWSSLNSSYIYGGDMHNSSLGNYWDDYKGLDENDDGIGTQAYVPYTSASDIRDAIGSSFMDSLSEEGVTQVYEGYWDGLFKNANYVKDRYPLISENSMYIVIPDPESTGTGGQSINGTSNPDETPTNSPPIPPLNITFPGSTDNETPPHIQGGEGGGPSENVPMLYLQHPFEIVFVMVLIAGVFSGILGIMGRYGRFYGLKSSRRNDLFFLSVAFGAMSVALLYVLTSYTSKLIYRLVDYGVIQVAFIFFTAYLITSSGFISLGLLRKNVPLSLYRLHMPAALVTAFLFALSLYTAPLDLGPITSWAYPASILLSIALPLVFRRRFSSYLHRWKAEGGDTKISSFDPDSTSLFMKEEDIMSSSLSSSYFPESLHDKYSDVEFIGKGGLARVFKARRRKDGVLVAVKVPINFDEITGRLFLKEMRIWEGLEHPNIAKLYSVNIFPVPYVEMEYLETPLAAVEKPLSAGEAVKIIYEVAEGLGYAHSRGIIHRDIKPQNIMLTSGRTAKITDWGLGKIMSDGNETTVVGFSLNYAAPEQVAPSTFGHPDERTDIYQLGIVFYELITGRKPFSGSGVAEVTDEILHKQPVPPSDAGVEDDLFDEIVMRCLEKKPEDRFSSVEEFRKSLEKIMFQMKDLNDFFTALNREVK